MAGNTIPAVEKAIAVIQLLGTRDAGWSQSALCRELDISPSSGYRLLQTLLRANWIRKNAEKCYVLSDGILSDCGSLSDIPADGEALQPNLEELAKNTGFTVKFSIRRGREQITLLRAESPHPIAVSAKLHSRFPIVEGSVGAALLSRSSEAEIRRLIKLCPVAIPERDCESMVLERTAEVRRDGYCLNRGVGRWKIGALSIPVLDGEGRVVGALTLLGHNEEFNDCDRFELVRAGKRTALECGKRLSH